MNQALTNYCASFDAIAKMLPSITNATGTVQVVNAWSAANETIGAADQRFIAKYPEVLRLTALPAEIAASYGRLTQLKIDYAAVPAGVRRLTNQFKDSPEVQEAITRFRKSLDIVGKVGYFRSEANVQTHTNSYAPPP